MSDNFWRVAAHALLKPRLLLLLLGAAWHFRRRGWYRRPPFLPLPSSQYMNWRTHTAFGDEPVDLSVGNLESYLRWTAWMRKQRSTIARTDPHWKQSSNT
jgi:hypothetical protein